MSAIATSSLDPLLSGRLAESGLDPADFGEPGQAWRRLHSRFGRRITLIDRYALEAARRGVKPDELEREERARLTREVLAVQYPGLARCIRDLVAQSHKVIA